MSFSKQYLLNSPGGKVGLVTVPDNVDTQPFDVMTITPVPSPAPTQKSPELATEKLRDMYQNREGRGETVEMPLKENEAASGSKETEQIIDPDERETFSETDEAGPRKVSIAETQHQE